MTDALEITALNMRAPHCYLARPASKFCGRFEAAH